MSLQITDNNLGIEVKEANVKISYFTINRKGFFDKQGQDGSAKFSANLYIDYSNKNGIYFKKCISIDDIRENETNLESLYKKLKYIDEFKNAKDIIPIYDNHIVNDEETNNEIENSVIE